MIYIIDNDPSVLKSLTRLISTEGYNVTSFTKAGDFLEHTKPQGPSCLVLDLNLPDQGGLDVQEEMSRRLPYSSSFSIFSVDIDTTRYNRAFSGVKSRNLRNLDSFSDSYTGTA